MRLLAAIEDPEVAQKILECLDLPASPHFSPRDSFEYAARSRLAEQLSSRPSLRPVVSMEWP
jgi:hypothetical protein